MSFSQFFKHPAHPIHSRFPKDMRMAADEFVINAFKHIRHAKFALFAGNLGIQHNLEQQVAKLLGHFTRIFRIKRGQGFVGLFQQAGAQALVGLLPIPGTAISGARKWATISWKASNEVPSRRAGT